MRIHSLLLAAVCVCPLFATAQGAPPTVAEARKFLADTNAELLALGNRTARADWVGATHITEDSS